MRIDVKLLLSVELASKKKKERKGMKEGRYVIDWDIYKIAQSSHLVCETQYSKRSSCGTIMIVRHCRVRKGFYPR